jgi:release factor glutamine methyltransferase
LDFIGAKYSVKMTSTIYQPSEDSYLFVDFLKKFFSKSKNKNLQYLDMGTGSGVLPETVSKYLDKSNILAADINPEAIKLVRKQGFKAIKTNLFEKIPKSKKFNIITFNAPYLPRDNREPMESQLATTGGKRGDEISVKFLKQAKQHLAKDGKIFLLISSLTPQDKIKKFGPKTVARKKVFFEELQIWEFS